MQFIRTLLLTLLMAIGIPMLIPGQVHAQEKLFTAVELAQFDGRDGHKAYFAYKGKVYDVSESSLWKLGEHFGVQAGSDLTGLMAGAPHGDEVMAKVPMIGTFGVIAALEPRVTSSDSNQKQPVARAWYDAPIRILGLSILGWTGIFLGIVFVLNFATCFALPWKNLHVPWAGSRPGPDALDNSPVHTTFASIHKYFAWATVVIGILHGILGFMQMLGFYL